VGSGGATGITIKGGITGAGTGGIAYWQRLMLRPVLRT
jgi:hypothetical protein